jgi:hypothetical protein
MCIHRFILVFSHFSPDHSGLGMDWRLPHRDGWIASFVYCQRFPNLHQPHTWLAFQHSPLDGFTYYVYLFAALRHILSTFALRLTQHNKYWMEGRRRRKILNGWGQTSAPLQHCCSCSHQIHIHTAQHYTQISTLGCRFSPTDLFSPRKHTFYPNKIGEHQICFKTFFPTRTHRKVHNEENVNRAATISPHRILWLKCRGQLSIKSKYWIDRPHHLRPNHRQSIRGQSIIIMI